MSPSQLTPQQKKEWVLAGESGQQRARRLMQCLRGTEGCPWDNKQTHNSLRKYLLEECYELADCIDNLASLEDDTKLQEELGDVYLQVLFHARIAEQEQRFDIDDVADTLVAKMIERHPHVFEDPNVATNSGEVLQNWERSKRKKSNESFGHGLPVAMPALTRAQTLSSRAAQYGFDWPSITEVWHKIQEEIAELQEACATNDRSHIADELGDVLFTVVNFARKLDLDAEQCLANSNIKFQKRFNLVLQSVSDFDKKDISLDLLESQWQTAKRKLTKVEMKLRAEEKQGQ